MGLEDPLVTAPRVAVFRGISRPSVYETKGFTYNSAGRVASPFFPGAKRRPGRSPWRPGPGWRRSSLALPARPSTAGSWTAVVRSEWGQARGWSGCCGAPGSVFVAHAARSPRECCSGRVASICAGLGGNGVVWRPKHHTVSRSRRFAPPSAGHADAKPDLLPKKSPMRRRLTTATAVAVLAAGLAAVLVALTAGCLTTEITDQPTPSSQQRRRSPHHLLRLRRSLSPRLGPSRHR